IGPGSSQPSGESPEARIAEDDRRRSRTSQSLSCAEPMDLLRQRNILFSQGVRDARFDSFCRMSEKPPHSAIPIARAEFGKQLAKPPLKGFLDSAHVLNISLPAEKDLYE